MSINLNIHIQQMTLSYQRDAEVVYVSLRSCHKYIHNFQNPKKNFQKQLLHVQKPKQHPVKLPPIVRFKPTPNKVPLSTWMLVPIRRKLFCTWSHSNKDIKTIH